MKEEIKEQLKLLPENSGSYSFLDKTGTIIYIGKAKNLKKRVSSYFLKHHDTPKLRIMVPQIEKIEFVITNTEAEALILEDYLIKKYKPKYNVLLKDDKKFPYIVITDEEYPRLITSRKANRNAIKGKYFGPFTDVSAMWTTIDLIKKLFPLKQCKQPKFKDRPCIYYHLHKCSAPCQKLISSEDYKKILKNVELFLEGKRTDLIEAMKKQMLYHSDRNEFEMAAKYRDTYISIQKTTEKQKVVFENIKIDRDVIAISRSSGLCSVAVLNIREGRLSDKKDFEITVNEFEEDCEIKKSFIREYYNLTSYIPKEIMIELDCDEEEIEEFKNILTLLKGEKVKITYKKTPDTIDIFELAKKNSDFYIEKIKLEHQKDLLENFNNVGSYIAEKLNLKNFPHRAECYDISHIQGTNTVASMVVFKNGLPAKSEYRKFKIKTLEEGKPDDFASMKEVLTRRLKKLTDEDKPDLIIIDGGKGQLSSVMEVIKELNLKDLEVVSLAKREEEIFVPNKKTPVIFPKNSEALFFFQRIRDEAHRFAITYHRKLRNKSALESVLDSIKGLSEKSKKILQKNFADIKILEKIPYYEISLLIPKKQAEKVYKTLHK